MRTKGEARKYGQQKNNKARLEELSRGGEHNLSGGKRKDQRREKRRFNSCPETIESGWAGDGTMKEEIQPPKEHAKVGEK